MAIQQLAIPGLFDMDASRRSPEESCIAWLRKHYGCSEGIVSMVRRLYARFGLVAWERAKALKYIDGKLCGEGWSLADAECLGIFDASIDDYHVLWDRCWAIVMGAPKLVVPTVWRCDYGNEPKFYDRDGALVYQGARRQRKEGDARG